MRLLPSHATAASPPAPAPAPAPVPAPSSPSATMAPGGGLAGTPAPSPSTSISLGLGSADDDGSLKSPSVAPPRRSLRLAGAASPNTPATALSSARGGASSGAGSGPGEKRRGKPRVSAAASLKGGVLGSYGGGGGEVSALGSGGSGGQGAFMSSRAAKRPVELDVHVSGEMWLGSDRGVGAGDQVYDEMPHQDAVGTAKRHKSISVGGIVDVSDSESEGVKDFVLPAKQYKSISVVYLSDSDSEGVQDFVLPAKQYKSISVGGGEYVADSESDDNDGDCVLLEEDGMKMPEQLSTPPYMIDLNVVPMSTDMTDEWRSDVSVKAGDEIGEVCNRKEDLLGEESMHRHSSAEEAAGGIVKPLTCPVGIPATDEGYVDMHLSEELFRLESKKKGKGKGKLVLGNNDSGAGATVGIPAGASSRKFSHDDKGKGKMVVEESSLSRSPSDDKIDLIDLETVVPEETQRISRHAGPRWKQAARQRAIELAPKFAFFKADEDAHSDNDDAEELGPVADPQDWPGPFSTARRIMDDRDAKLRARELNPSRLDKYADKVILWTPSKDKKAPLRSTPSLTSLCLQTLANHAEGIESLGGIPEELKHKLLTELCRSRKMNTHLLTEFLCDNPVTLQLSECSWLSEDDFEIIFGKCRTEILEVLQLDLSGRCMPDYMLPATLAKVPNCMPLLKKLSLKGNYRLSDNGLDVIISAAPSLNSLNLSECSLLTATGIKNLANKLHSVLRELYIDDCPNVEAMMILPALQKIKHLEVLSMSGIQSVCDKFVNELIPVHCSNMKELAFSGCLKLTSSSIKTIAANCPQLSSLDLRNLNRLRDSAMRHLRDGCRLMKKLQLQRNTFSDEAVSQFLEESGGCLTELSLNNVEKVGNLTARAIALKCSMRLEVLDLSFCRDLTNEALGLIADSCSSLRILKLFGCTQITDVFLKGHSNSFVKIIGTEGGILEHMDSL